MVTIYLRHYGGTFEEMARKHNGGPQGHKKECTKKYWEKVKTELERSFLSEIDSIYLSNDSSTLYGLEKNDGKLYKFDTKTGEKTFLYEKKLSRVQNIVWDYDGKLYMQGIHF